MDLELSAPGGVEATVNDLARRAGSVVAAAALAIVRSGCATSAEPATATSPRAEPSAAPTMGAAAAPRRPLAATEPCPLDWEPREVGSVLRIPAEVIARPIRPVVAAACRCVHPGEDVRVVAEIDFTAGHVVADAPDAPDVAQCLARIALPAFEPWSAGSGSDCIDCGPRRYGVFRGSPPVDAHVGETGLRVVYPLRVDRRVETRGAALAP